MAPPVTTYECPTLKSGRIGLDRGLTVTETALMTPILRDRGLSMLVGAAELKPLCHGFQFTEGPLAVSDGSLLFQDIRAERTFRLLRDGTLQTLREQTKAANGQTWLPDGSIVFCEQNGR